MKRPLSTRLETERSLAYGYGRGQPWFRVNGEIVVGYTNLIELVLERFARAHGRVSTKKAWSLHQRLAYAYSTNPSATFSALNNRLLPRTNTAYPKQQAYLEFTSAIEQEDEMAKAVSQALSEKRQFIPVEKFDQLRKKHARPTQRWEAQFDKNTKEIADLKECRKLLRQIKETLNENA